MSNNLSGIVVGSHGGSAKGILDRVSMNENGGGLEIGGSNDVTAVDSEANDNTFFGIVTDSGSEVLRLAHSTITGNANTGVLVNGGTALSAGNNAIRGNFTDVSGTLTNVGTK